MQRMSAARQLALWVGRRGRGAAVLRSGETTLTLHVDALQIVGVEGDDGDRLAAAFGLTSEGEWFREAAAAVQAGQVSQGEANAVVKRAVSEQLRDILLAEDAEVSFESRTLIETNGLTLSFPHMVVEMVLGSAGEGLVDLFLPDPDLVLHRLPDFARRVGSLGLTDEALAVFAKINDTRTAREIAEPSPHGSALVLRLMAAAVGAGLVDAAQPLVNVGLEVPATDGGEKRRPRRRWFLLLLVVAVLAVGAVAVVLKPWDASGRAGVGGPWAVAVDGGCEPAEVERLYRRQDSDKADLRVVPFGSGDQPCFRLAWGHYPDRGSAERAVAHLPAGVLARGFAPHVVKVEEGTGQ